jgi:hypothetical protein
MSKLNPKAKSFIPKHLSSDDGDDMIFIVKKGGKAHEINLNKLVEPEEEYKLNSLKAEKPSHHKGSVYVNHFFGWSLNQILNFLRDTSPENALDVIYEALRQRTHLNCLGVIILFATHKGLSYRECEERAESAFTRFFPQQDSKEYDTYVWMFDRELNWAKMYSQ